MLLKLEDKGESGFYFHIKFRGISRNCLPKDEVVDNIEDDVD